MTAPLAILLPPSASKALGGDGPPWRPDMGRFGPQLAGARIEVADALARDGGGTPKAMGVSGAHLERARQANRVLLDGPPSLPAGERYTGVLWEHLGLPTLPPGARRRAGASIVVVSGLLGLTGIDDPTPDYRLRMNAAMAPFGGLGRWWRPRLSAALNGWLDGRVVIDLLSQPYAAAWDPEPERYAALYRVDVIDPHRGVTAGHHNKTVKGLLARHLLTSRAQARRALATFDHPYFDIVY